MGGSLAVLADGILQAALDLPSLELVKRGSGRLQEFKLMPMPGVGQNHLGGTWRGMQSGALEGETSGWSRISLGQEELRSWPSDPDVLLAVDGTHFLPKRKLWLVPAVATPEVCHRSAQGDRRGSSVGYT